MGGDETAIRLRAIVIMAQVKNIIFHLGLQSTD